jgi:hypothetical protein
MFYKEKSSFLYRLLEYPTKNIQFKNLYFMLKALLNLGIRHQ